MTDLRPVDARALGNSLERSGVPLPHSLSRALEILELAEDARTAPEVSLLGMSDADIIDYADKLTIRLATKGTTAESLYYDALYRVAEQATKEAEIHLRSDGVNEIVKTLRPGFDTAAEVLHRAVSLGITPRTTAGDVLDMNSSEATQVWREIPGAIATLDRMHEIRRLLSQSLDLSPTPSDARTVTGSGYFDNVKVDYSVCYAAGENWTTQAPTPQWLFLAVAGLRLNTPDEVKKKYSQRVHPSRPVLVSEDNVAMTR